MNDLQMRYKRNKQIVSAFMYFAIYIIWRSLITTEPLMNLYKKLGNFEGIVLRLMSAFAILIVAFIMKCQKKHFLREIKLTKSNVRLLPIMLVALLGLTVNMALTFIMNIIPFPEALVNNYSEASSQIVNSSLVLVLISSTLMAPILEETVFRGMIFNSLDGYVPTAIATTISAALFGLIHGSLIWMIYTFIFGVILAYIVHTLGSLIYSIIAHIVFNLCGIFYPTIIMHTGPSMIGFYIVSAISIIATILLIISIAKYAGQQKATNKTVVTKR